MSGDGIYDDRTGEFLAGIVTLKDVTEYTDKLAAQTEENEQQFQLICDTMPQMVNLALSSIVFTSFADFPTSSGLLPRRVCTTGSVKDGMITRECQ